MDQNVNQPQGTWPWTAATDDCGQWAASGSSQAAETSAAPNAKADDLSALTARVSKLEADISTAHVVYDGAATAAKVITVG